MTDLLSPPANEWLTDAIARVATDRTALAVLLPQLPRRVGRAALAAGRVCVGDVEIERGAFRACDAAAHALTTAAKATPAELLDLFQHGDMEERIMVMRAAAVRPADDGTAVLLGEAQRSNTMLVFEAAVCDTNLVARSRDTGKLDPDDLRRLVLKLAFNDLPIARVYGVERHADGELTRMLQDFATEREAAGRPVWADTYRLIARAPRAGTVARLLGGLEHGADAIRAAAIDGLAALRSPALHPWLRERVDREPRADLRQRLERALAAH
jgi:L-ribulose-5-phosphate 3-epimerase